MYRMDAAAMVPWPSPLIFGNRSFDNGLIELRNELEIHGFHSKQDLFL